MKPYRILSNLVGFMLFVQVTLGGITTLIDSSLVDVHIYWGIVTFAVLIVATVYGARMLGRKTALFRVGIAAIIDFIIQAVLGLTALITSNDAIVVVHLTNAFVLGVLVTYLISFADSADKAAAMSMPKTGSTLN